MSDVILERIAVALEAIAKGGGKVASTVTSSGGAVVPRTGAGAGAGAGAGKATQAGKGTTAAVAGSKGGANKPAPAAAKAAGGKYNSEQVRDIVRKVATTPSLGKQSALDILDQDGGGVTNVTNLKPENFDKVYEACQALLSSEGGGETADADEFDPTA